MEREKELLYAAIMAGGRGERFWPLSRISEPKQFLRIKGKTLLEMTHGRLHPLFPEENIMVVTTREYGEKVRALIPKALVLEEPLGKNTAPACFFAAWWVFQRDPEGIVFVLPADHWIPDGETFRNSLKRGIELARKGFLVTFGIRPTRPETGYGYVERGELLETWEDMKAFKVKRFKEKPERETAEKYMREGRFYWNSGMFAWKARVLLDAFRKHAPSFFEILERVNLREKQGIERFYSDVPEISIDYLIMEKAENRAVVEANFEWEDLGAFRSLASILERNSQGNFTLGDQLALEADNNVLVSRDGLVAVIGVQKLVVVHTPDVTLVVPLEEAQRVKEVFKEIERREELKKYIR